MLSETLLFIARLLCVDTIVDESGLSAVLMQSHCEQKYLQYRIEHSLLAMTGAIGLAVLPFIWDKCVL